MLRQRLNAFQIFDCSVGVELEAYSMTSQSFLIQGSELAGLYY